jgi:hypothetical protein
MSESPVAGITIQDDGDTVTIEVDGGRWQGSASDAERLLTRLHYVLGRARPGTHIVSLFLDGKLWGGKVIEEDRRVAIREIRAAVDDLARFVASLEEDENESDG